MVSKQKIVRYDITPFAITLTDVNVLITFYTAANDPEVLRKLLDVFAVCIHDECNHITLTRGRPKLHCGKQILHLLQRKVLIAHPSMYRKATRIATSFRKLDLHALFTRAAGVIRLLPPLS